MQNKNDHHHQKKPGGVCCCRCICYSCCLLSLVIAIQIMIFFHFNPKLPIYKIERIDVKALKWSPRSGLTTHFLVAVTAKNPNKKIEFICGKGGWVVIEYSGIRICSGELPAFRQRGESTTRFKVELKGKSAFRSELVELLMEQQSSRRIPVMLKLKVPVGVVVGEMRVSEMNVFVNLSLVLGSLSPDIAAGIVSTKTVFRIQILSSERLKV